MSFSCFLMENFIVSILIIIVYILKLIFKNKISCRLSYFIWLTVLGFIMILLLPLPTFDYESIIQENSYICNEGVNEEVLYIGESIINDFAENISVWQETFFIKILFYIWVGGVVFSILILIRDIMSLHSIVKKSKCVNSDVEQLMEKCKKTIQTDINIYIIQSKYIDFPVSFRLRKYYIALPNNIDFENEDLFNILLHEIVHIRNRDVSINSFAYIVKCVYWFNPIVNLAIQSVKKERELYCDYIVMEKLPDNALRIAYGHSILNMAERNIKYKSAFIANLFVGKKQLSNRIFAINNYCCGVRSNKLITNTFVVMVTFIFVIAYIFNFMGKENDIYIPERGLNISYEKGFDYLENYKGSYVLCDVKNNKYYVGGTKGFKRVSPYSTYKPFGALNALENKVITINKNEILWNGDEYPFPQWNENQSLNSAMKNSVNWYFQNMDNQLGLKKVKDFFIKINYGNKRVGLFTNDYWLKPVLKISPFEQADMMKKLYKNDFGFSSENINAVKKSIFISREKDISLYGKTGSGIINGKKSRGWFIGYVENGEDMWSFAVYISGEDNVDGMKAKAVTTNILKDKGILK